MAAAAAIITPIGGIIVWLLRLQTTVTDSYSKLNKDTNEQYDRVRAREKELEDKIDELNEKVTWLNSQMLLLMAELQRHAPDSPVLKAMNENLKR